MAAIFMTANAQNTPPKPGGDVIRLAELAELRLQVDLTSARVEALLSRLAGVLTPEDQALMSRTFRSAFRPDAVYEDAIAYLQLRIVDSQAQGRIEKFDIPLVKKMVRLEVEATRPEHRGKIGEYVQSLNPTRAAVQKRLQLISRLDEATRTSEQLSDLNIKFIKSFSLTLLDLSPPDKRPSKDEQARLLSQLEAKVKGDFEDAGIALFLYAFRSVPDVELEQYVKVCEAEEGRWFAELRWAALSEAFSKAGERFGEGVSNVVNK